jgi:hypothetical protein
MLRAVTQLGVPVTVANGGTNNPNALGAGQIAFFDGTMFNGDANLTWDATNGLSTNSRSLSISETSASSTQGLIVGTGATKLVTFQGLDSGGTTFAFFGNNRQYGVGGWGATGWYGARTAFAYQVENGDQVRLYRFPAASNSGVQIWGVNSSGPAQYSENTLISDVSTLKFGIGGSGSAPFGGTAGAAYVDMASNKPLYFGTNDTLRVTIDSTGFLQMNGGKVYFSTDAAASQTAAGMYAGTGVPNNANGANGDFYFRSDGGVGSCIYQRRAGSWVATGA